MEFKCSAITKTIILVLMIFVIKSNALNIRDYEEDEPRQINGVKEYKRTRECSMAGGFCVNENDCEPGEKANMPGNGDICANGSDVVCCYSVIARPTDCHNFGGICQTERCPDQLKQPLAIDCDPNQTCCILVT